MKGWNLEKAELTPPANRCRSPASIGSPPASRGFVSNPLPFALDTLPEVLRQGTQQHSGAGAEGDAARHHQRAHRPAGRLGRVPVHRQVQRNRRRGSLCAPARFPAGFGRSNSPTRTGRLLAFNDDHEDLGGRASTRTTPIPTSWPGCPADGTYYVHLGDTARNGGEEYAYRLRISAPQPDFALRVVPSSVSLRSKSTATLSVYVIRKDGFTGPIKLGLKNPPAGFSAAPVSLSGTQAVARLTLKTDLLAHPGTRQPLGRRQREDPGAGRHPRSRAGRRPDAGLLVAASGPRDANSRCWSSTQTTNPRPNASRAPAPRPRSSPSRTSPRPTPPANKPKFTKQQVAGRLRQLKLLFEEGLLTDDFYDQKVAECEAAR